jgi:hypothetical protein
MNKIKLLSVVTIFIICCLLAVWLSTSIQGSTKTYEVRPNITIPESRTDAARAIDAYESLMERYMDLTEKNLFNVGRDTKDAVKKLDSIDLKLTQLSARIAAIEKALGIEQPKQTIEEKVLPESPDRQPQKKSLPSTEK